MLCLFLFFLQIMFMNSVTCKNCNNIFFTENTTKIYCSVHCRKNFHRKKSQSRLVGKVCENCGKEYQGFPHSKTCSPKCAKDRVEQKNRSLSKTVCVVCEKEFYSVVAKYCIQCRKGISKLESQEFPTRDITSKSPNEISYLLKKFNQKIKENSKLSSETNPSKDPFIQEKIEEYVNRGGMVEKFKEYSERDFFKRDTDWIDFISKYTGSNEEKK